MMMMIMYRPIYESERVKNAAGSPPEAADSVDAGGAVLTSEISSSERGAFVDILVAERTLPAGSTLTEEAVVLVDARSTVTTRVTETLAHRQ